MPRFFANGCVFSLDMIAVQNNMESVAQLVRASDCGSEGRGFESHLSPASIRGRKIIIFLPLMLFKSIVVSPGIEPESKV